MASSAQSMCYEVSDAAQTFADCYTGPPLDTWVVDRANSRQYRAPLRIRHVCEHIAALVSYMTAHICIASIIVSPWKCCNVEWTVRDSPALRDI